MNAPIASLKRKKQIFEYIGLDAKGTRVKGEIPAPNITIARATLQRQGITPTHLAQKKSFLFSFSKNAALSPADLAIFTRQLATMAASGIALVQSLNMILETSQKSSMTTIVQQLKTDIEKGIALSEALKKYPASFDTLYCSLIEAAEHSGTLDLMLDRIATYKEKTESIKRKIKKAMYYPATVITVAFISSTVLLLKVVPTFKDMFKSFGAELPGFTLFVLNIADVLQEKWPALLVAVVVTVMLLRYGYRKGPFLKELLQRISLRLPLLGAILSKAAIARFARTLATSATAGVPVTEALDAIAGAAGNVVYTHAIRQIKEGVTIGQQLNVAVKKTTVFPPLVVQMISVGEESGALDKMLNKIALLYEEEVEASVDGLSTLLEPIIILILGVVVGGLVIAMYLPIFKMGSIM